MLVSAGLSRPNRAHNHRLFFYIADKRELGGIYKGGGRCGERLRAKAGGGENLEQTRWSGGRGYSGTYGEGSG